MHSITGGMTGQKIFLLSKLFLGTRNLTHYSIYQLTYLFVNKDNKICQIVFDFILHFHVLFTGSRLCAIAQTFAQAKIELLTFNVRNKAKRSIY